MLGALALGLGRDALRAAVGPRPLALPFDVAGVTHRAWLYGRPSGSTVAVLLHGGAGVTAHERAFAGGLSAAGFPALVVRYSERVSGGRARQPELAASIERVILAALDRLRLVPGVDDRRIALIGFSLGGHFAVRVAAGLAPAPGAVIVFYGLFPETVALVERLAAPLLVLQGEADDPALVGAVAAARELPTPPGREREFVSYPGAGHQFDLAWPKSEAGRDAWIRVLGFLHRIDSPRFRIGSTAGFA